MPVMVVDGSPNEVKKCKCKMWIGNLLVVYLIIVLQDSICVRSFVLFYLKKDYFFGIFKGKITQLNKKIFHDKKNDKK